MEGLIIPVEMVCPSQLQAEESMHGCCFSKKSGRRGFSGKCLQKGGNVPPRQTRAHTLERDTGQRDPKVPHLLSHECCIARAWALPILVGSELWWVVKIKSKQRGKTSLVSLENELVEPPGPGSMAAEATLELCLAVSSASFPDPFPFT